MRFSGETAVFMGIWPLPNANSLDVIKRVRSEMKEIEKDLPTGLQAGIAYDGTSVWVTNYGSLSVSKVNASTNAVATTLSVGKQPYQALYSFGSVWVTNFASAKVSRIRPA